MKALVSGLIVHYKTPKETYKCLQAFRHFYKDMPLLLIDNSNYDDSSEFFYDAAKTDKNTTCVFNSFNMHHGPSMDLGLRMLDTKRVFVMDSDLLIVRSNLVENMHKTTVDKKEWLVVGNLADVTVNGFGREATQKNLDVKYCSPKCMLINRNEYLKFPPFILHGAPCIETMKAVKQANKTHMLIHFDCKKYSKHLGGVTQHTHGLDGAGGNKIPPFI